GLMLRGKVSRAPGTSNVLNVACAAMSSGINSAESMTITHTGIAILDFIISSYRESLLKARGVKSTCWECRNAVSTDPAPRWTNIFIRVSTKSEQERLVQSIRYSNGTIFF